MSLDVSERWLIQIACASAAAVLISALMRPSKAGTARVFPMISALMLVAWIGFLQSPLRIEVATTDSSSAPWVWQTLGTLPALWVWLWFVGVAGLVGLRLLRLLAELRDFRRASNAGLAIQKQTATLAAQSGFKGDVRAVLHDGVNGPCATSMIGNVIVLPRDAADWAPETLRAVLCHELVHLKRRDDRWLLFVRTVRDLYWPLFWVWWLPPLFERHMEASCDDEASELCGDDVAYCSALGEISRRMFARQSGVAVAFGGGTIARRVRRFLGMRSRDLDSGALYWLALIAFALAPIAAALEIVHTPIEAAMPELSVRLAQPETRHRVSVRHFQLLPGERLADARRRLTRMADDRPIYPGHALLNGVEGDVWIEFAIAADGRVVRPQVIDAEPPYVFERASLSAVERADFEPIEGLSLGSPYRMRVLHQYRLAEPTTTVQ